MLDYHALKERTKVNLLARWQRVDLGQDPFVWIWIARALSAEGLANNPIFQQTLEQGRRWLQSPEAWASDAQLAVIGILCSLFRQAGDSECEKTLSQVIDRVRQLRLKDIGKFSRLNDPDFVFGLSIGFGREFPEGERHWLAEHAERNAQTTNWRRGLLFAAAASEFGATVSPLVIRPAKLQVYEVIPSIWFAECYPSLVDGDDRARAIWEAFELVKEGIGWEEGPEGTLYTATPQDTAMLYEALVLEARAVNPVTLFNNLPLHLGVRQSAESLFIKGEYVNAVFEAAKVFIDAVKHRAGNPVDKNGKALDGVVLIDNIFDRTGSKIPKLKFNALSCLADQNEHDGLYSLARGVAHAFRNPKGHLPKAAITLTPYEALEQLTTISYLMRRLDAAQL